MRRRPKLCPELLLTARCEASESGCRSEVANDVHAEAGADFVEVFEDAWTRGSSSQGWYVTEDSKELFESGGNYD